MKRHVVAMNKGGAASIAKRGHDFHGIAARDQCCFLGGVGDEPATDLAARSIADNDGFAALELAADAFDAGGKQASARLKRRACAIVDHDDAFRLQRAGDPALACGDGIGGCEKPGAGRTFAKRAQADASPCRS